jgi:S-DNA-T family DNA segregation ATPase FtsK/SpoIIIE
VELAMSVSVPSSGASADVLVTAPEGACLGDVAPSLLARALPDGASGRLLVGGVPLSDDTVLGLPPLVRGAVLEVAPAGHAEPSAAAPPPTGGPTPSLRVTGGPDAGRTCPIGPSGVVVGRGVAADLPLDDPDVSRQHCRLEPGMTGWRVVDLHSANGTTVDGVAVPSGAVGVQLSPGAVLRVGRSALALVADTAVSPPVRPTGDGRARFNRPPRIRAPHVRVQVVVPAPPGERERAPLPLLAALAPLVLGVVMWRLTGSLTFLLFTLLSPVLLLGGVVTERRSGRRASRAARALWRAQRDVAETTLAAAVREDEQRRRHDAPGADEALAAARGPGPRLWERRRYDDDFLELRLGLADQPARVEAEGDVQERDLTAGCVPVLVPLQTAGVLGLSGPREESLGTARWLVLQAATWHSPRDLSVVVLADSHAATDWDWAAWLPHTRPDDAQDCRALLGLGLAQAAARVRELTALVELRTQQVRHPVVGSRTDRAVLVVVDGARALRAVPGLARLLVDGPAAGVFAICLEADPQLLPEECRARAVVGPEAGLALSTTGRPDLTGATADLVSGSRAETAARALAPLRDDSRDRSGTAGLPTSLRWTDAVGLALDGTAADAERVADRWRATGRSTAAVVGEGSDGPLTIDLVRDGPHTLVAGTTGSGKSELLQTLVASLALANRPDELAFVLVDYKGGAAFGPCAQLPHTAGLVTDLDAALVERALASLRAELARRESVLAQWGAKDVEEHRRLVHRATQLGQPASPLPRLVLVVDEFASLVEELPDFVGGLVGIAMRGRSLGVHLVLATQRPEGVVSADIRANTNLRLCLAVARDTESRDVIDSPLAATISRATPGRGYVRTGHGELSAFQAARIGGRRPGAASGDAAATVQLLPVAELGDALPRPAAGAAADDTSSDLDRLVQACAGASELLAVPAAPAPWVPPLPEQVLLADLPPVEDPLAGVPGRVPPVAYALLDDPERQSRRALVLDLDGSSHLMVLGSPRAGRTTALRTLAAAVAASASPDDVHLYAVDLGGGGLAPLTTLPHTGAVVGPDQPERVDRLLSWLADEVVRRQGVLASGGHSDLAGQRGAARPEDRLPHLLLLLDRWEGFLACFQDLDAGRLVDLLLRLVREGPSVGLHVVLTSDRTGLMGRIGSLVEERLLLRMADAGDYTGAGLPRRLVPTGLPAGRGWSLAGQPLAAQVALLDPDPSGPSQVAALRRLADQAPVAVRRPRRFELLPASVQRSSLIGTAAPRSILVGVGGDELEPVCLRDPDVQAGLLVAGPPGSGRSTALLTLAAGLRSRGLPLVVVAPRPSPLRSLPGCVTASDDVCGLEEQLRSGPGALLVDDAELLVDSPLAPLLERAVRDARDTGTVVVVAGTTDDLVAGYRGFVVDLRRARTGLLLSPRSADGDLLGVRLSRVVAGEPLPGRGLLVVRGRVQPLQVAQPE